MEIVCWSVYVRKLVDAGVRDGNGGLVCSFFKAGRGVHFGLLAGSFESVVWSFWVGRLADLGR